MLPAPPGDVAEADSSAGFATGVLGALAPRKGIGADLVSLLVVPEFRRVPADFVQGVGTAHFDAAFLVQPQSSLRAREP